MKKVFQTGTSKIPVFIRHKVKLCRIKHHTHTHTHIKAISVLCVFIIHIPDKEDFIIVLKETKGWTLLFIPILHLKIMISYGPHMKLEKLQAL